MTSAPVSAGGGRGVRVVALLLMLLVGAAALWFERPPAPVPAGAPTDAASAERAADTVAALATEPRPIGSPASDRVRDDLVARLRTLGLDPRVQVSAAARVAGETMVAGRVENVVATLPGTDPTGAVVLTAHYDSVHTGPGAADAMAGVAGILEAVRAVRAGPPLRNDVVVLLTDGEEVGLLGAQAWVRDELVDNGRPTVTVSFEARGVAGPALLFRTSPGDAGLVRAAIEGVPHLTGDSSLVEIFGFLPNDTDLSTVLDAGRPGLDTAFVERAAQYHSAGDTPANLSAASLQDHAGTALGLARTLGGVDLAPLDPAVSGAAPGDDAVWFRFLGFVPSYPQALAWVPAGAAVLAVAAALALGRARALVTVPGVLVAMGATVGALVAGVAVAIGGWALLVALRPSYADTGPFLARGLAYQLADVVLALLVTVVWWRVLRGRVGTLDAALGPASLLALLGVLTAGFAPGASFLFAWPALGLGVGWALWALTRGHPIAALPAALGALGVVALLVPLGWATFGTGGVSDGVPVLVFVLVATAVAPVLTPGLVPGRRGPAPRAAAWATLAAALVLALGATGLVVDRPSPAHPQAAHLSYHLDADTGIARWVSADTAPAPWTAQRLDLGATPAPLPGWITEEPVATGPAPATGLPAPTVRVVEGGVERVVLDVASPRGAPTLLVRADRPIATASVSLGNRPTLEAAPGGRELRLEDVGPQGARVTLVPVGPGPISLDVADASPGLGNLPGLAPRPPELRPSPRRDGELVVVSTRATV